MFRRRCRREAGAAGAECPRAARCCQLRDCASGDEVAILRIADELRNAPRLRELGLLEGARVVVLRASDPLLLLVQDGRIAVDRQTAAGIEVRCA